MELIVVRHARPERIEDADGPADPPLTDVGHRQARAVAGYLGGQRVDALYVSPMVRARQTAAPLERLLGVEATVRPGLVEFDADDPSYIPVEELQADKDAWKEYLANEANTDRSRFVATAVATIDKIAADHRGQRVVVVCHGGVINAWAHHVMSTPDSLFFNPDYTSINRFMVASTGEKSVVSLNETPHLVQAELRLGR